MNTLVMRKSVQVSTFVAALSACSMQGAEPSDLAATDQALTAVTTVDFESYALGPLPSPWSVTNAGATTVAVENTSDHGKAAVMRGGTVSGDFAIASLPVSATDKVLTTAFDLKPAANSAFVFAVNGAGSSIGARRIRLQRNPGSDVLFAQLSTGTFECGPLTSGVWSRITLVIHTEAGKFDVSINGAATACSGTPTRIGPPFNSLSLMDASNDGFGGVVSLDNISVSADAAPPCTPPPTPPTTVLDENFDAAALGTLPAPWSVSPTTGRSTARIVNAAGQGRALQLHGSTRDGDTVTASRGFSSSQTDLEMQFALRPNSGSSFIVDLRGAGSSISERRIRLQRAPGSNALVATTSGATATNVTCGTLASNAWTDVTLSVHTAHLPHTFGVRINGQGGACTGLNTGTGTPFTGVNLFDPSNTGWGGDVLFDEFLVTGLGAPSGSCPP